MHLMHISHAYRAGLDGDASRAAARTHAETARAAREARGSARLKGADALEKAKALLEEDTYAAKQHLAQQEQRFKALVGAKLEEVIGLFCRINRALFR